MQVMCVLEIVSLPGLIVGGSSGDMFGTLRTRAVVASKLTATEVFEKNGGGPKESAATVATPGGVNQECESDSRSGH